MRRLHFSIALRYSSGSMDQMSKQQYAVIAPIRCQPEEKQRLEYEAAKKGLTLANYIRRKLGLAPQIARARTDLK